MKASALLHVMRDANTDDKLKEGLKPRVLVVDDDDSVRIVLCEYLMAHGFDTAAASNGASALNFAPEFRPNIALLDICMPGMNGLSVLTHLKKMDANMCIIMLTGVADLSIAQEAMKRGADDYLTKPLGLEMVKDRLMVFSELLAVSE